MDFFVMFLEIPNFDAVKDTLIKFKRDLKDQGNIIVIDTCQENYDFREGQQRGRTSVDNSLNGG